MVGACFINRIEVYHTEPTDCKLNYNRLAVNGKATQPLKILRTQVSLCRLRFEDIWVSLAEPTVCLDYQTKDEDPMTVLGVTIGKAEEHASEPAEACLSDWRRDCNAIVLELPGGDQLSARLRELGILPGTLIRVLRTGAHLVVQTGDTRLALRREDCDGVRVGAVPAVI